MPKIEIEVVEELVRALGRATKKCPTITGVRIGTDGSEPIIIVDSDAGDEEPELIFPKLHEATRMILDKIAIFKWDDAAGKSNWNENEDPLKTMLATACGLLIREDDHAISIGMERFEDGAWRDTLTVPKTVVQGKIKYFVVPESVKTKTKKESSK